VTISTRVREESGFGIVELLIAMTVMVVGIMGIVAGLSSGIVAVKRAGDESTAAALADTQMEAYRALPNCAIYLNDLTIATAGPVYTADGAYVADATKRVKTNAPLLDPSGSCAMASTPTNLTTAHQSLTGADGRSYWVDTFIVTGTAVSGTLVKKVTLVVRDPHDATNTRALVRESSEFTPPTGCNNPVDSGQRSTGC
jgi:type II secretory pathway pseudopilin PulG